MKERKKKRGYFFKRLGITLVIPLFLMVIGLMMIFIPLWGMISEVINYSSLIFYDPSIDIQQTQFTINDQTMYRPLIGKQFATLSIDAVSLDVPIFQGESAAELRQGAGHYVLSLLPGEGGNVVLSGHRETAFYPLKDVEIGDLVVVETEYGQYQYEVSDIYVTTPDDITPTEPTETEKLTMYTCYPFIKWGPTPQRYVVVADFVSMK